MDKISSKKIIFTRQEFYDLVWSTSLSEISKKYSITNTKLKNICKEYKIPLPENGYWQKLKHQKTVTTKELTNDFDGENNIDLSQDKVVSPYILLTKKIEVENAKQLIVPQKLSNPDPLIIAVKKLWKEKKNMSYRFGFYDDELAINVENENKRRASIFMDSLIKLLKKRGHSVKNFQNATFAVVYGVDLTITLREAKKRVPIKDGYSWNKFISTGIFVLKTGRHYEEKEWRDGKLQLESQLSKIVAKLELDAKKEIKWQKEIELYHKEQKKIKAIEEKQKEIYDNELLAFKTLQEQAENYNKAILLRNYISAFKNNLTTNKTLTPQQGNWINWANKKADWVDPLIDTEDEILSNFNQS